MPRQKATFKLWLFCVAKCELCKKFRRVPSQDSWHIWMQLVVVARDSAWVAYASHPGFSPGACGKLWWGRWPGEFGWKKLVETRKWQEKHVIISTRWWFSNIFYFYPYLGKIPILTNIFQLGWNHQLVIILSTWNIHLYFFELKNS